ncbi:probable tRNA sulfurtransferase [Eggerthella sp. CAG:1427]|nr:probable tRNA sulfurtransferase [Eggerthella sp. CAG:1427]
MTDNSNFEERQTRHRVCLVHYHEIGLKGHNRKKFEQQLISNIEALIQDSTVRIRRISGRICLFMEDGSSFEDACSLADQIAGVPGIARVSSGYRCAQELDEMYETACMALNDVGEFQTFKVQARRNHTDFAIDSMQLNQLVGAALCRAFPDKKVAMKNPDVEVRVEVIQGSTYIYGRSIQGIGGLPVGSAGKAICLLSSGIDSPVATWRIARRGATCIGVHFSGRPETSATSEYLVQDIAEVLERTGCFARLYIVPIGTYQREISALAPPELRVILYRRLMFRIADRIANREGAKALVTGESLGQVASQTMDNMLVVNQSVSIPIYRPLVGFDKIEIINEAQKLGTFEISSQDAPDCCTLFMPRNPETHAKLPKVLAAEESLPMDDWAQEALDNVEIHTYTCPSYKIPRVERKAAKEG